MYYVDHVNKKTQWKHPAWRPADSVPTEVERTGSKGGRADEEEVVDEEEG